VYTGGRRHHLARRTESRTIQIHVEIYFVTLYQLCHVTQKLHIVHMVVQLLRQNGCKTTLEFDTTSRLVPVEVDFRFVPEIQIYVMAIRLSANSRKKGPGFYLLCSNAFAEIKHTLQRMESRAEARLNGHDRCCNKLACPLNYERHEWRDSCRKMQEYVT